ncbi:MAG: hypothetical protein QXZ70_08580, partial [Candidatus Bathyarchaeia archaeon]
MNLKSVTSLKNKTLNSQLATSTIFMSQLKQIEEKWRVKWEDAHIFEADPNPNKPKLFVTFPYPYMNGPLHVG